MGWRILIASRIPPGQDNERHTTSIKACAYIFIRLNVFCEYFCAFRVTSIFALNWLNQKSTFALVYLRKSLARQSRIPATVPARWGASWGVLGASWGRLGRVLEPSWGRLGAVLGVLGRLGSVCGGGPLKNRFRAGSSPLLGGRLGASWGRPGGVLGASWGRLGSLGASWARLGAVLRRLGDVLGRLSLPIQRESDF